MTNGPVVEDVLKTIRELTAKLKAIREEVSVAVFQQEGSSVPKIFLEVTDSAETISQFRAAIDDLRHMLWLYVQTSQNRESSDPDVQRRLLARATEILCALSMHPPLPQIMAGPMEGSFVERLLQFMETWVEPAIRQKMEGKKEVRPA